MTVSALTAAMVSERVAGRLGLDSTVHDALTPEATAEALRRAASLLCPATPGEIVDAVRDVLAPLADPEVVSRQDLANQVDLLIANGDLLELRQPGERTRRLVYLGPPSFLAKLPGQYLVLGVRPENQPLVDEELSERIEREGHLRFVSLDPETGPASLTAAGLQELRADRWLRHPPIRTAAAHLAALRLRLAAALEAGEVAGLEVLDPAKPVHHYRDRWRPLDRSDNGDFMGRRPQAYGSAAWCFVRVLEGHPSRLLDLPAEDPGAHARDEAWRLQSAIDAARGTPQLYRLGRAPGNEGIRTLDLFGPLPSWAARQLDLVGTPLERRRGSLLSYRLPELAVPSVTRVLTEMLWMQSRDEGGTE